MADKNIIYIFIAIIIIGIILICSSVVYKFAKKHNYDNSKYKMMLISGIVCTVFGLFFSILIYRFG